MILSLVICRTLRKRLATCKARFMQSRSFLIALALSCFGACYILISLPRCGIADHANDINTMLGMVAGRRMRISGVIVDDDGQPLSSVEVKIKKLRITDVLFSIKGKEESETRMLDSEFNLNFKGWHDVYLTFSKKGYHPVKQDLIADSEEGNQGFLKDGMKIVLRQLGETAISLKRDKMRLGREPQYDKSIRKTGWVYKKRECEKYGIYERVNNIPYDDPSEVDIYAERAEDDGGIYLIANDDDTGFTELMDAKDFTYLPEAPEGGYQSRLLIPYLPLAPGDDPERRRSADWRYCYFKLKEGFYGKMKVEANEREGGEAFSVTCVYFLNPDGSRNLRSMDK